MKPLFILLGILHKSLNSEIATVLIAFVLGCSAMLLAAYFVDKSQLNQSVKNLIFLFFALLLIIAAVLFLFG